MSEKTLRGKTIAFLVATEGIEQVELSEPWKAVREAGGTPRVLPPESGDVQAFHHLDRADTFPVDEVVVDGNLVTSRKPEDLPSFTKRLVEMAAG
jgi:protease I